MKKTSTQVATIGAAVGILAALLAMSGALTPVFAATQHPASAGSAATVSTTAIPGLTVGQVFNITSTQGHFRVVGDKSENGTASGTVTFTVTGKFANGYTLSMTSGTLDVNGTTYAITSGSAQTGRFAHHMVGQGTTALTGTTSGATASGAFLMRATARGTFGGEYATMSLDLQSGTTEYAISLVGTIQG
ncbi:MAG TPA: hypothetical protein VGS04_03020 [Nitrososphaerales archaeon]|nr:hypothetical protein [Nitrososphaerales archaeon]